MIAGSHSAEGGTVRSIPEALASHPGNIFLAGENVVVPAPPGEVQTWRAVDYDGKIAAKGLLKDGKVEAGALPVGWYKIVRGVGHVTNRTFVCVLERLRAATPLTSPVCIDVAMAWFFPPEKMSEVASLCRLAGINRVRDRLLWEELEPKRGEFSGPNKYDASASSQVAAGLQILQVCHLSARWANPDPKRFPLDLRDIHEFYREMAARWKKEVGSFEPWNEADIAMFGGHTGSEMATLQKAAYLGLKAGNPKVIACQNVFAIRRAETLKDFQLNQAWPYYDTYNLHHYEPLANYPSLYADHRAVCAGKPIWVSECSVHVKWRGDEKLKELGDEDLRLQSERLTKTYALAIYEGAQAIFYFMLPHYSEGQVQFGLLRPDLTPRPGYAALAATGRLLADAKPVGRVKAGQSIHGYLYQARPDGKTADVMVIWSDLAQEFPLRKMPVACFDHLGRPRQITNSLSLSNAPLYVILPRGYWPSFDAPPQPAKLLGGEAGCVVIQAILPETDTILKHSAYHFDRRSQKTIPIAVYNFGTKSLQGKLRVVAPGNWKADLPENIKLAPKDRKEFNLKLAGPDNDADIDEHIRINGDFGGRNQALLSLHFVSRSD